LELIVSPFLDFRIQEHVTQLTGGLPAEAG
jgi:hypothetical protein